MVGDPRTLASSPCRDRLSQGVQTMDQSEWIRIALAMALMLFGFILLPAFFLMRDKRVEEREAAAAISSHEETGVSR
jgi:hypothetical protein